MNVRPDTQIGSLALRVPVRVGPETSLHDAAGLMRTENISALVVDTHPASIVTERDLVRALAEDYSASAPVRTVASRGPLWAPPSLTIAHAAAVMIRFGLRHILVVDETRTPVGVLSVREVLDVLLSAVDPNGWLDAFPQVLGDVG